MWLFHYRYVKFTLMWNLILTPFWLRNDLRNCHDIYSNYLDYIDTRFIDVANMKFSKFCVHSIKNYWWMSKLCVYFCAGYICNYIKKKHGRRSCVKDNATTIVHSTLLLRCDMSDWRVRFFKKKLKKRVDSPILRWPTVRPLLHPLVCSVKNCLLWGKSHKYLLLDTYNTCTKLSCNKC